MKKTVERVFKPYITLEQIYAFDPARPETSTGSPFVDKILSLFANPEVSLGANFSGHLGLDAHDVAGYLFVATGYRLVDLRRLWTKHKVEELRAKNPRISQTDMALILGYKNHTSMWRFLNAEEQTRKQRQERHERMERVRLEYLHR